MHSAWQQLTLSNLPIQQWVRASYVHTLVGSLQKWRQSSWLMQWADPIGVLLLSLVFALAPFVSTTLVGLLIAACIGFWVLLTLTDQARPGITPIHVLVFLYWGIATAATVLSPVKKAAFLGWGKLSLFLLLFMLMARVLRSPYNNGALELSP
jgi:putative inorganic carbon (hco3(-)) transporter